MGAYRHLPEALEIPPGLTGVNLSQPDITLILDMDGVIQEAVLSNAISGEGVESWVGRAWTDTVGEIGTEKVRRMVEDACATGVSAFWQVTQHFPSGLELPVEYTTVRRGEDGGLIAIGKSLQAVSELQSRLVAAQHAMEQDYWKLREVETRYRLLFDASNEAVLLLRAGSLRVVEANPAAIRALGLARDWDFLSEIAFREREPFQAMLVRVREQGKAPGIVIHLGPEQVPWAVRASLMNTEPGAVFLLQLVPVGSPQPATARTDTPSFETLIDRLPDGFVLLDRDGIIRRTNQAFVDMLQVGAAGAVVGERLERWLRMPGADAKVLLSNLRRNGTVRSFPTTLQGELGNDVGVEISAAGNAESDPSQVALILRDTSRRLATPREETLRSAFASITLPGTKAPLRKLIQDAVTLVERYYIGQALKKTEGNRTAAAELLGLSRQSLYAKLNRYELDGGSEKASERSE